MLWDPEIEAPATLGIIGGGLLGVEAALYGRMLGYDCFLLDAGRLAGSLRAWGDRPLAGSAADYISPLGRLALAAQFPERQLPDQHQRLLASDLLEQYLLPLAKTDLVRDQVLIQTEVLSVSRLSFQRREPGDWQARCNDMFWLGLNSRQRGEFSLQVDAIIDCTGLAARPAGLGPGGGQALGQSLCEGQLQYRLPTWDDSKWAGRRADRWVLLGAGPASFQLATELAARGNWEPSFRLQWVVPSADADRLPAAEACLAPLGGQAAAVVALGVERLSFTDPGGWRIELLVDEADRLPLVADWLWAPDSRQPDVRLTEAIRVVREASEPWPISPAQFFGSLWQQQLPLESGVEPDWAGWQLATTEPHYYWLAARPAAAGGLPSASPQAPPLGDWQARVRDLYALMSARRDLDLYQRALASG
jgi:hypothetical protein